MNNDFFNKVNFEQDNKIIFLMISFFHIIITFTFKNLYFLGLQMIDVKLDGRVTALEEITENGNQLCYQGGPGRQIACKLTKLSQV